MKKFLVDYRPALGSYLDQEDIHWESKSDTEIYIYCNNERDLFAIALDFQKWLLTEIN